MLNGMPSLVCSPFLYLPDHKALRVNVVHRETEASRDLKVFKAYRGHKVRKVKEDLKAYRVSLVKKVM